jgi:uncharacterized protein YlxW (UPF0749 family)
VLGYDSAGRMMKELESAPRRSAAIAEATKAYMTQKHGDIRYDGTLDDQARLAVENEKRAQNLHSELSALRRKLKELKGEVADQKAAMRVHRSRTDRGLPRSCPADGRIEAHRRPAAESLPRCQP